MTKDEALKLALEAFKYDDLPLTHQNIHAWDAVRRKAITAIKKALAAPVQEPAFYGFMDEEECCVNMCFTPHAPGGPNNELATAYYTSPPAAQRQWVDMPELELLGAYEEEQQGRFGDHVRGLLNVQAKLKEKNT